MLHHESPGRPTCGHHPSLTRTRAACMTVVFCILQLTGSQAQTEATKAHPVSGAPLRLDVYVGADQAYNVTSTLIYGRTESMLVDAQFHSSDASKLADRIAATHTKLRTIFITHPDLDHYIGLAVLHQRFPDASIYMTARALEEFKKSVSADLESARRRAPEETPSAVPTPQALPSTRLEIDGQPVLIITDQQGDFAEEPANSFVYVSSLRAVIAGDIVFATIHPWLAGSTPDTRSSWRSSLELLKALKPEVVVAGHGAREPERTTAAVAFTERYLEDFEALRTTSADADQFVSAMQKKYPTLGQLVFLKIAARSVFAKPAAPSPSSAAGNVGEARQGIEQAYAAWSKARMTLDKKIFEKTLAEGFYVQLPGQRLTREEFMQRISDYPPGVKLTRFEATVLTVQPNGDAWTALITEKVEFERTGADGKTVKEYTLWVARDGWKKAGEEWRLLSSEAVSVEAWKNGERPPMSAW